MLDGAKAKPSPEEKASYLCEKKDHLFRNCLSSVKLSVTEKQQREKTDKDSSCGTLGHHSKEARLKTEVNGRCYSCLLDTESDVTIFLYSMMKGYKL